MADKHPNKPLGEWTYEELVAWMRSKNFGASEIATALLDRAAEKVAGLERQVATGTLAISERDAARKELANEVSINNALEDRAVDLTTRFKAMIEKQAIVHKTTMANWELLAIARGYAEAAEYWRLLYHVARSWVFCSCGDAIRSGDDARCGVCVMVIENNRDDLIAQLAMVNARNKKQQRAIEVSKNYKKIVKGAVDFVKGKPPELIAKIKGLTDEFAAMSAAKEKVPIIEAQLARAARAWYRLTCVGCPYGYTNGTTCPADDCIHQEEWKAIMEGE